MNSSKLRFTTGMLLRMGADAVMVNAALLTALALWFMALVITQDGANAGVIFRSMLDHFTSAAWPLTLVCLVLFYFSGFYTYGRAYQSRYKALIVTQAVTQGFLAFGFLSSFFGGAGGGFMLPRSALVLAWLFSLLLLVGSRVWTTLWVKIVSPERAAIEAKRGRERTVLVIGGAGYIGSALLPKLLDKGYRVRVLDLMIFGDEPVERILNHPRLEIRRGDFRHVEQVAEALAGVDSVVHLGAIVGDPACNLDEELTIEVNLTATRMIAELAKAAGVERFVFASTCSVYGATTETLDERSIVRPISLYGHTKLASERVLLDMATERFAPTVLRFATIYGLSGRTRFDLVVNLLTAKAKIEGKITVFGGEQWRPFVHVDDAALAVSTVLEAPQAVVANQIFNVGSNDQNYTIQEIGELVHQCVISADLILDKGDGDRRDYRVNFNKIRNLLGFAPRWTVRQGIQQVLDAIANGDVSDYSDPRYSNVKFLREKKSVARDNWAQELVRVIASQ
ncbi:MAG: NAD-dependent epimerase/dehydratase family protein [Planctomycetia bacterium]|nr:NAD-dependent epimerase/dehydratase family protein [Planctomycetia bacterium]